MDGGAVVACARTWLGTRFSHQGRLKRNSQHRGGVDCLGLLVGVARELDIRDVHGVPLAQADVIDYSHMPDVVHLRMVLESKLQRADVLQVGDVLLLRVDDRPQHMAIVTEVKPHIKIIHAYAPAKAVVEHVADATWQSCICGIYRMIGAEGAF